MWLPTRLVRVAEPLIVAVVCAWLAYGSMEKAKTQAVAAAVMGSLLGGSFLVAAALLAAGLVWGGAWRELPTSLSWSIMQKLEVLPILLHTATLSHWSYRVGRLDSTPVFSILYSVSYLAYTSVLEIQHVYILTVVIFAHHCSLIAYEAMTLPGWSSLTPRGKFRWLDTLQVMIVLTSALGYVRIRAYKVIEGKRKEDFYVHTRAKLLRDAAHDLVVNFLPAPVMTAVQERIAHAVPKESPSDLLDDSDIVAWAYDPACVLQSDIVGFTALGSRVSPQELCRYDRLGGGRVMSPPTFQNRLSRPYCCKFYVADLAGP